MRHADTARLIVAALALAAIAGPAIAQAPPAPPAAVTWASLDPGNDWAATVIRSIFPIPGIMGGTATGTAATVISTIVGQFTAFIAAIAAAFVSYTVLMNIFRAAETSRVLGANQSWMAVVRVGFAAIMMFPANGGWSAGQALVMNGALAGVGMARNLYQSAIQAVGPDAITIARPMIPGTQQIVAGLIENELCLNLVNVASNTASTAPLVPRPTETAAAGSDGSAVVWNYRLSQGNGTGAPACGNVTVRAARTGAAPVAGVPIDMAAVQRAVLDDVLRNQIRDPVRQVAEAFWNTRASSTLAPLGNVLINATNAYTEGLTAAATSIAQQLNDAVQAQAGTLRLGDSNLLTGQVQQSTLGWSAAGAYYLQIARLNASTLSLMASTPVTVAPAWDALPGRLRLDIAPLAVAARDYLEQLQLVAQTQDGTRQPPGMPTTLAEARAGEGPAIIERVLRAAGLDDGVVSALARYMLPQANVWTDPFGGLMSLGQFLINTSLAALGAAALLNSPVTAGGTALWNFFTLNWGAAGASALGHLVMQFLGTPVFAGLLAILAPGIVIAFVLPMVPWVMWMAGVTGWIILVIEAMIAVPLWMLAHMTMGGQGLHGRAIAGWSLLFSVVFRPAMMVVGLFLGYFVFAAMSWLIRMTFGTAAGFVLSNGWLVSNLLGMGVLLWIFVSAHVVAALMSFRLVAQLPQHLPNLLGFSAAGRVDHDDFTYRAAQDPGDRLARGTQRSLQIGAQAWQQQVQSGVTPTAQLPRSGGGRTSSHGDKGLDSTLDATTDHRRSRADDD